jgi:hypothetical protein
MGVDPVKGGIHTESETRDMSPLARRALTSFHGTKLLINLC